MASCFPSDINEPKCSSRYGISVKLLYTNTICS